jgi:hypothetical protein
MNLPYTIVEHNWNSALHKSFRRHERRASRFSLPGERTGHHHDPHDLEVRLPNFAAPAGNQSLPQTIGLANGNILVV